MQALSRNCLLIFFGLLFLLKGQSQQPDKLLQSPSDTSAILAAQWERIEQYAAAKDTARLYPLLESYQRLSHQYGFRFEEQFEKERLHFTYHQLFDELFLLMDQTGDLTIDEVLQPKNQAKFMPNNSDSGIQRDILTFLPLPTAYDVSSVYWLKLKAKNLSAATKEAWFMIGWNERTWKSITAYKAENGQIKKIGDSGLGRPIAEKMAEDWRSLVQIKVKPQSEVDFYFRLSGAFYPDYPDRIALYHFDNKSYWSQKSFALLEDGLFLGMTFLLLLLTTVLYYYDRQKDTLFFLIHLAGICIHDFANKEHIGASNLSNEFFPTTMESGELLGRLGFFLMFYGFDFFAITFLNAKEYAPKLRKLIVWVFYIKTGLYAFISFFELVLYPYFEYPYMHQAYLFYTLLLLTFLTPLVVLILGVVTLNKKNPLSKLFILAFLPIVLVSLISFFGEILFSNFFSSNQLHIASRLGHLANYVLFAIAIVYKRQMERKQIMEKRLELDTQLYQEKQEARRLKELDSFKTQLYTNLTHEFRTPLTVILGITKQLSAASKQELAHLAQLIERNGRNLLEIINQLLDLSKLENNAFQLHLQNSDIVSFFRYVTNSFQSYANSKNLSLQFHTTIEQQHMDFDPKCSTQILSNLISNALKFTSSGGNIIVKVSVENDSLLLRVSDTGIGIPTDQLPNIFDRFFQVDNSSTRKGEGTGIGLAHTKLLVELMRGRIIAESELGRGTTFFVHLPIQQSIQPTKVETLIPTDQLPIAASESQRSGTPIASPKPSKQTADLPQILIIEDNPDVVFYLQSCLVEQYQLDIAYNGRVGIEKAIENIPDLIISDVMMPEKDGYEVCDQLKKDEKTSHIPIILLTAKADNDSKMTGLRRGADAYLTKPFDKEELLIRLSQMIAQKERLLAHLSQQIAGETKDESILIEDAFIQKVRQIVARNFEDEHFALPMLCKKIGMSRSQLYRKMKALIDVSPSEFIRNFRLREAKKLLAQGELNVSEVTYEVGFRDVSHFSKIYQEAYGHPPSKG